MKGQAVLFSSDSDEWSTPKELFFILNCEFNFTLDPCAAIGNAKCPRYYTKFDDGILQNWTGERLFINPPYSNWQAWAKKAVESQALSVLLLPARTDTKAFHEYFYKKPNVEIRFLKGRLKFGDSKNCAPFPSMIVIVHTW